MKQYQMRLSRFGVRLPAVTNRNYKIKLKKNKGSWVRQRTLNLNKHQPMACVFVASWLMTSSVGIPQIMGLWTQFVHLLCLDENGS